MAQHFFFHQLECGEWPKTMTVRSFQIQGIIYIGQEQIRAYR